MMTNDQLLDNVVRALNPNKDTKYTHLLNEVKALRCITEGGYRNLDDLEKNMGLLSAKLDRIISEYR
tara:strand:+ start:308 stop:508 length:201 start_codon:yes stop_codon:yes gene_type:complete